ncbi:MAG: ABC transporter permease [Bdellovibrionales bacterium]|nr:ABC transporter permease [Bdellovibrionales bacterium]
MPYFLPFWTLLNKEVQRWFVSPIQTLIAPMITSSLYLFIFGLSLGKRISVGTDITYIQFVVPGLVLMGVLNNTFANSSFSLFMSRYLGHMVDLLVTPIGPAQFIIAYTLASILRGLVVGGAILFISCFFTTLPLHAPWLAFLMAGLASFMIAQLGIIAGICSDSFEAISIYTTFLLLPLIYLGGMFYPISILPSFWQGLSRFNPLFYTIDGFRHCLVGVGDAPIAMSFMVSGAISIVLFLWAAALLSSGYNMRK